MAKERYKVLVSESGVAEEEDLPFMDDVQSYEFDFEGKMSEVNIYSQGILFQNDWTKGVFWAVYIMDEGRWRPLTKEELHGKR